MGCQKVIPWYFLLSCICSPTASSVHSIDRKCEFFRAVHRKKNQYRGIRLCLALPGRVGSERECIVQRRYALPSSRRPAHIHARAYTRGCRSLRCRLEHPRVVISSRQRETAFLPRASCIEHIRTKETFDSYFTLSSVSPPPQYYADYDWEFHKVELLVVSTVILIINSIFIT